MWLSLCHLRVQLWPWVWKDTSPGLISSRHTQLHQHHSLPCAHQRAGYYTKGAAQQLSRGCPTTLLQFPEHWDLYEDDADSHLCYLYPWGLLLNRMYLRPPSGKSGLKTCAVLWRAKTMEPSWAEFKSLCCLSQLCSLVNFPLCLRLNFILYRLAIMICTLQHFKNYK